MKHQISHIARWPLFVVGRRPVAVAILLAVLIVAASPGTATAATLQVCSVCAYVTIQSAVDASSSGDVIEIARGVYREQVTIDQPGSLVLRPISGRVTIDATGFDTALEILDPQAIVNLIDLNLRNADGWAGLSNSGYVSLTTVYITNNSGTFGGVFNTGSLVTHLHTVINGNTATALGSAGGLNNFAWVDLWHTAISGNQGHEGGGFKTNGNSRVTVFASSISGNHASSMGGGYFNSSPQGLVDIKATSTVSGNTASFCDNYYDSNQSPDCVN